MPRRSDIESILIIGAGPIVIGQACEFDYSGVQACKSLTEEGYRVILVNSNPATVMTDPAVADATYIEPLDCDTLRRIIIVERPDALLSTMGGQTALNLALELQQAGVLDEFGVELLGARGEVIVKAEQRDLFDAAMRRIGLETPQSGTAHSMDEARAIQRTLGFPCIIRPSFTLGGSGGGIARTMNEFEEICERGFKLSPTSELLIDESLLGWKEYELEVIRDCRDNCIIVCSIENIDPMGIHTGDSITVAPAQTLTDKEYQRLRNASLAVLREIGVDTGGSNVQFAVEPDTGRMVVIEMNPRVSRSSALASKATGFPIAKVAAKLAVGYTLDELRNSITGDSIPASFEPSIDYVVTKIPRFAQEKFSRADHQLATQMKSVGEVMAIGRTFKESLLKALRGLETGISGLDPIAIQCDGQHIERELSAPGPDRLLYIADALRCGMTLERVQQLTSIDPWFLHQIADLVSTELALAALDGIEQVDSVRMRMLKKDGFSDATLARILAVDEDRVRAHRYALGVRPVFKRIDSCAAEFAATTAYMYATYERECEADPGQERKVIVLGGGPNRIGQGIEFDYCCVHAVQALRDSGIEAIMINCNPETVSTDYDTADRLYFESITVEDVLAVVEREQPEGVIVQFGGQTPLRIARSLERAGVPIIGTPPDVIDCAEDRERFQQLIVALGLLQPRNAIVRSVEEASEAAKAIGYPLIVRPSYVLGGRAMEIVDDEKELQRYMIEAVSVSPESPVLLDYYLNAAIEVDVDAICDGEDVLIGGVMQHIEQAGIHSGDSACSLPTYSLDDQVLEQIRTQTRQLALALGVNGLMNVQFAVQDSDVYVLEVNPRASRTVPFVSKCIGHSLAHLATRVMVGERLSDTGFTGEIVPVLYSVKEAVFPFVKFPGVDPILGPEMRSTGEVMGVGDSFAEAFLKAQRAAGTHLPEGGVVFISVRDTDKAQVQALARSFSELGFALLATSGTAHCIRASGLDVAEINKVFEGSPHIVDRIAANAVDLIINTTEGRQQILDSATIRSEAVRQGIPCATTLAAGYAVCEALRVGETKVRKLQEFFAKSVERL